MSIGDFFGRIGDNISSAPPEAWFSLAQALSGTKNVGTGLAQGIAGFGQASQASKKKASLAEALKGAMGSYTPEQQAFLGALEPDQAAGILGGNMFPKAPTEKWVDLGNGKQQNVITGKVDDIPLSLEDRKALAAAGRSNVTVNNLPAEVGARIGMGEGFLERFDDIKQRLGKLGVKGRAQLAFNTGEGGEVGRWMASGQDALVRGLTGAGMAIAEANQYASRYAPSPLDTDFDLASKADQLKRDLERVAQGAYSAKGGKWSAPQGGGDLSDVDAIVGLK